MIFFGNFSEVGGFPKTLHNFLGWSDEILTLPYKGRYMVKKWQKRPYVIKERPLRNVYKCDEASKIALTNVVAKEPFPSLPLSPN